MKYKYLSLGLLESQGYRANHFSQVWKEKSKLAGDVGLLNSRYYRYNQAEKNVMVYLAVLMNKGISGKLPEITEMEICTLVREKNGGHSLKHSQK